MPRVRRLGEDFGFFVRRPLARCFFLSFDLHLCLLLSPCRKTIILFLLPVNSCDTTVHGANETTAKHLRLPLPQFSLGFTALSSGGDKESKGKEAAAAAATATTTAAAAEAKGKGRASSPEQQARAAAAAAQSQLLQQRAAAQAQAQAQQQQQQNHNPYGDLWAPSAPGMTLAAELLGLPPDAVGDFSVKDVDAAYMLAEEGGADFDADLSAILEVPDIDFLPPPPQQQQQVNGASGSGAGALPLPPHVFYGSNNDGGAGPSNAPAPPPPQQRQQSAGGGRGTRRGSNGGGEIDGVVPELPKRARR